MACLCTRRHEEEADDERMLTALDAIDFRHIAQQASAIPEVVTSAIRHLEKSERAEQLGLGADVATLFRQAAQRDNTQAVRQVRAVIARLDDRTSRDDWGDLVEGTRREFEERDGRALIEEARGRVQLGLFEMDGLSPQDAVETAALIDEALDRARDDGLNGVAGLLRQRLERGLQDLQSPNMGREHATLSRTQLLCIGIVSAVCTAAMIACAFIPACWCCLGYWIIASLIVSIAYCHTLP